MDQIFRHPKSTQHQNPNYVQKVPVGGTNINCPMAFVVVSTSERLHPYVTKKNRASKHMCSMNQGKCKTDSVKLAEPGLMFEVCLQQLKQPKALQKQESKHANARQNQEGAKAFLFL